jgi:N-methylhydantoinase A/oxoprolinase/acetone carboxylase beta subunit
VGVIRLGKPATMAIEPMIDWPEDLSKAVSEKFAIVHGGFEFDGREIVSLDEEEIKIFLNEVKDKVEAIAITGVFSPISNAQELRVKELAEEVMGDIPVSLSSEIGSLGLLERENAAILNASLSKVAKNIALSFKKALEEEGIVCSEIYLCQNDGTLMSLEHSLKYPILTIACGPTNSIRGAGYLSSLSNALVLDVGGTTSDIGVIINSFPRESAVAVEIGGARTNFRMPDLISIALGGGTVVKEEDGRVVLGPESVGYKITEEALVFGGKTLTTTDIAVRLGMADIGDKNKVSHIDLGFANKVKDEMYNLILKYIDNIKLSNDKAPLILVGGGSILIPEKIEGISEVICPENHSVANAIGAAIAQVSGQCEKVYSLVKISRDDAISEAREKAIKEAIDAGADEKSVEIVEVEDIPLAYLPGNATRIKVKAAGNLKSI